MCDVTVFLPRAAMFVVFLYRLAVVKQTHFVELRDETLKQNVVVSECVAAVVLWEEQSVRSSSSVVT